MAKIELPTDIHMCLIDSLIDNLFLQRGGGGEISNESGSMFIDCASFSRIPRVSQISGKGKAVREVMDLRSLIKGDGISSW